MEMNVEHRAGRTFQTVDLELLDSLVTSANRANATVCGVVGTAFLPRELCDGNRGFHTLAIAVPDAEEIDWTSQRMDALVPHNELDFEHRQATTLILLGDGPVAIEPAQTFQVLFDTEGSIFVIFLHRGRAIPTRYKWNERLHCTLDGLGASAGENYRHDEERAARSVIVMGSPVYGATERIAIVPAAYFEVESDGSLSQYSASTRLRSKPQLFADACVDICSVRQNVR